MKVLVTQATGFAGKFLIQYLLSEFYEIKAFVRQLSQELPLCVNQLVVGNLVELALDESSNCLREMFNDTEVVVHAAASVHVMQDDAFDPLTEFRKVNRDATLVLARLAFKIKA